MGSALCVVMKNTIQDGFQKALALSSKTTASMCGVAAISPGPQPFPLIALFSVLLPFNDQVIESWAIKTNTADPCKEYHSMSAVVTVHKAVVRLPKDCCLTIFTTTGIIIVTVTGIHR